MMPFLLGIIIAYICGPAVSFANKRFNFSIELTAGLFIIFIYVMVFFLTINIVPSIYKNLIEIINKIMEFDPNKISKSLEDVAFPIGWAKYSDAATGIYYENIRTGARHPNRPY
jgi:predicted PurR-regulated permease PerM